jgi:hypothetical protein
MGVFGMHVCRVVEKVKSKKYEYKQKRTIKPKPVAEADLLPPPLSVDDLRDSTVVALHWFGTWIVVDVRVYELDGRQVSLRSRDAAHRFHWTDVADIVGPLRIAGRSGARLYAASAVVDRLSESGRRLLAGSGGARGAAGMGRDVRGSGGGGAVV